MSQPLRVGIVGCGVVATAYYMPHMLRRKDDITIAAVCDNNERRARACAKLCGVAQEDVYVDYYDMLQREDIDAMFILTGPGTHAPFAIAAAEAGKHILLQKPMALNLVDAQKITDAVEKAGVKALIEPSDHALLDKRYDEVAELVRKGALGDPYWFDFTPYGPDDFHVSLGGNPYGVGAFYAKDSGGFLFDFPYAPNQICRILGSCKSVSGLAKISIPDRAIVPDEVYDEYLENATDPMDSNYWEVVVDAPKSKEVKMEAPDNVYCMYEMVNGWIGVFHAGRMFQPVPKGFGGGGFNCWGTEGNLVMGHGAFAWISSTKDGILPSKDRTNYYKIENTIDWSKCKWPIPPKEVPNYYEQSTDHLLECIREDKEPIVGCAWGRHITEMMWGAMESDRTGQKYVMTTTLEGLVE